MNRLNLYLIRRPSWDPPSPAGNESPAAGSVFIARRSSEQDLRTYGLCKSLEAETVGPPAPPARLYKYMECVRDVRDSEFCGSSSLGGRRGASNTRLFFFSSSFSPGLEEPQNPAVLPVPHALHVFVKPRRRSRFPRFRLWLFRRSIGPQICSLERLAAQMKIGAGCRGLVSSRQKGVLVPASSRVKVKPIHDLRRSLSRLWTITCTALAQRNRRSRSLGFHHAQHAQRGGRQIQTFN